jgi:hypothetical protein
MIRTFFEKVFTFVRERVESPETKGAQLAMERIEAAAAQGGGSVVLPSGREVMVHVVPSGRLDVGSAPLWAGQASRGKATPLSGSRQARFKK